MSSYQLTTAKVWDGAAWVAAAGGGGGGVTSDPWFSVVEHLPGAPQESAYEVSVTGGASPNTWGAWTEIIASTTSDANLLIVGIESSTYPNGHLIEVGLGASGAETTLVPPLAVGGADHRGGLPIPVPVLVPAGSRISARGQADQGGDECEINIVLFSVTDTSTASSVDVYGVDTATSQGVTMSGATEGVTWVEIESSTSAAYRAIVPVASLADLTTFDWNFQYKVGVGAVGEETALPGVLFSHSDGGENLRPGIGSGHIVCPGDIPAGSRLSVQWNGNAKNSRIAVCLIGVR